MAKKRRPNLDFPAMVEAGENPNGFTSQTANGTAHDVGAGNNDDGWRGNLQADGPRWNGPRYPESFGVGIGVPASASSRNAAPKRRGGQTGEKGNRTGE